jgi:hypothetical protein
MTVVGGRKRRYHARCPGKFFIQAIVDGYMQEWDTARQTRIAPGKRRYASLAFPVAGVAGRSEAAAHKAVNRKNPRQDGMRYIRIVACRSWGDGM